MEINVVTACPDRVGVVTSLHRNLFTINHYRKRLESLIPQILPYLGGSNES